MSKDIFPASTETVTPEAFDRAPGILEHCACVEFSIPVQSITLDAGYCFRYDFRTQAGKLFSRLSAFHKGVLFEDGQRLTQPNALHERIRKDGLGLYSFWTDSVYFSSSDNSDPRTNERVYTFSLPAYLHFLENMPDNTIKTYKL